MNLPIVDPSHRPLLASRAMRLLLCLSLLLAVATPRLVRAELNASLPTVGQADKNFAREAARGLMRDIGIATMAQERATKKQIKTLMYYIARRRVGADAALRRLARSSGLQLPTRLDAQQKQEIDALQKLQGAEFDKAALRAISDPGYVRFFEFELKDSAPAKDAKVKAYAREQLPVIRKDVDAAKRWLEGYDRI
ncbi:MAG: DUF4142 domain-containing protein [Verrucomicrobiota bacterium]|nr:DUF4142 domain-containing protein [Verrucomicrobiota bacterium]